MATLLHGAWRDEDAIRNRLRRLSRLMDTAFTVPGTQFRFGFDALLDLVPGIGDVAGKLIAGYIILEAAQLGVPKPVLLRMAGNVGVDFLVGAFPVLGAVFGAAWRSNVMNMRLMDEWFDRRMKDVTPPRP